ncbi:hypothetical protein [Anaerotignum propionicum]|nr:hypothetical protein [Anaerotignum propionicum]
MAHTSFTKVKSEGSNGSCRMVIFILSTKDNRRKTAAPHVAEKAALPDIK